MIQYELNNIFIKFSDLGHLEVVKLLIDKGANVKNDDN